MEKETIFFWVWRECMVSMISWKEKWASGVIVVEATLSFLPISITNNISNVFFSLPFSLPFSPSLSNIHPTSEINSEQRTLMINECNSNNERVYSTFYPYQIDFSGVINVLLKERSTSIQWRFDLEVWDWFHLTSDLLYFNILHFRTHPLLVLCF